jgi:hypothetical protein
MSEELSTKLRVGLIGQDELLAFYNKSIAGVQKFRTATRAELSALGSDITGFAAKATRALGTIGGIGAGINIATQAKGVLELRDAVAGLASTAGLGEDSLVGLRKQILSTSLATNQLGMDVTEALNAFVAKTGDIETGRKNLELYGKTATAARAQMADIANIGAELPKLKITDQATALAILAKQSDVGAVELKDLVKEGPRLLSSFQGAGLTGMQGLREGGAFAQMAMKGTGNVDMATTAVEAAFRDIAIHHDRVENAGIDVYDPKTGLAKNRMDVIKQLIEKSGGKEGLLTLSRGGGVFDSEGMRAIRPLIQDYLANGGKFSTYDAFRDVSGDQSIIDRKYALNSQTGLAKIKRSQIRMAAATDANFGDIIEGGAGLASGGLASAYELAAAHPLLLGGGLLAGRSALRMLGGAGRAAAGGGGISGALSAISGGGMPVTVTNWPEGFGGGVGALGDVASKATQKIGVLALAAQNAQGVLAALGAGVALGTYIDSKLHISDKASGTTHEQFQERDRFENESAGGRAERELGIAQDLARKVRAGKLDPRMAAKQLLGFEVNAEHIGKEGDKGNISPFGQKLLSDLFGGDAGSILDRTTEGARNEQNTLALKKYSFPGMSLIDSLVGSGREFGPTAIPASEKGGALGDLFDVVAKNFQPSFTINIAGEEVTVDAGSGTRAPKVMVKRTSGSN